MTEVAFQSGFDLSDLNQERQIELQVCVAQYKGIHQRVERDMYFMAEHLNQMKEILGPRFYPFVRSELGISERTARRMLQCRQVLVAHFSDEQGRIKVAEAANLTSGALQLLTADAGEEVIEEIRTLVQGGHTVDAGKVRELLDDKAALQGQVASVEAELDVMRRQLNNLTEKAAVDELRHRQDLERQHETVRRLTEQRSALEEEVAHLNSQATVVTTKEVEVVPAGYKSAEDAIADAQARLAGIAAQEEQAKQELDKTLQQVEAVKAQTSEALHDATLFSRLKEQVDAILSQYPKTMLAKLSGSNDQVKQSLNALGKAMIRVGEELAEA